MFLITLRLFESCGNKNIELDLAKSMREDLNRRSNTIEDELATRPPAHFVTALATTIVHHSVFVSRFLSGRQFADRIVFIFLVGSVAFKIEGAFGPVLSHLARLNFHCNCEDIAGA
jgi:hypothetical protein